MNGIVILTKYEQCIVQNLPISILSVESIVISICTVIVLVFVILPDACLLSPWLPSIFVGFPPKLIINLALFFLQFQLLFQGGYQYIFPIYFLNFWFANWLFAHSTVVIIFFIFIFRLFITFQSNCISNHRVNGTFSQRSLLLKLFSPLFLIWHKSTTPTPVLDNVFNRHLFRINLFLLKFDDSFFIYFLDLFWLLFDNLKIWMILSGLFAHQ